MQGDFLRIFQSVLEQFLSPSTPLYQVLSDLFGQDFLSATISITGIGVIALLLGFPFIIPGMNDGTSEGVARRFAFLVFLIVGIAVVPEPLRAAMAYAYVFIFSVVLKVFFGFGGYRLGVLGGKHKVQCGLALILGIGTAILINLIAGTMVGGILSFIIALSLVFASAVEAARRIYESNRQATILLSAGVFIFALLGGTIEFQPTCGAAFESLRCIIGYALLAFLKFAFAISFSLGFFASFSNSQMTD